MPLKIVFYSTFLRSRGRLNLVLLVEISLYLKIKFKRELEEKEKLSLSNEIAANTDETDSQETNESSFIKSNYFKKTSSKPLLILKFI